MPPELKAFELANPVYLLTAVAGKNLHTDCLSWGSVESSYSPLRGHRLTEEVSLFPARCGETGIFIAVTSRNMVTQMQLCKTHRERRVTEV